MSSPAVEGCQKELTDAKAKQMDRLAYLQLCSQMPVNDEHKRELAEHVNEVRGYIARIDAAMDPLHELAASGYPHVDVRDLSEALQQELEKHVATLNTGRKGSAPADSPRETIQVHEPRQARRGGSDA